MSSIKPIQIRPATEGDLEALHRLAIQLGYQPSREVILKGLIQTQGHPDYETVVLDEQGEVLGWMTLHTRYRIHDVPALHIVALVTDENRRGEGLGKKMLAYAEAKAKREKLASVDLYSNKIRTYAHIFYERAGYPIKKESFFFKKVISQE